MNKKAIAGTLLSVTALGGLGYGMYTVDQERQYYQSEYEKSAAKVIELETTLAQIGPITQVYALNKDAELETILTETDFELVTVPTSITNSQSIKDLSAVFGENERAITLLDVHKGQPLTSKMVSLDDRINTYEKTIEVPYFPIGMEVGSHIDITAKLPKGEAFPVFTHIRVEDFSLDNGNLIDVHFDQGEMALWDTLEEDFAQWSDKGFTYEVNLYKNPGSYQATPMYPVSWDIEGVIIANPDIQNTGRYVNSSLRSQIENRISNVSDKEASKAKALNSQREGALNNAFHTWYAEQEAKAANFEDVNNTTNNTSEPADFFEGQSEPTYGGNADDFFGNQELDVTGINDGSGYFDNTNVMQDESLNSISNDVSKIRDGFDTENSSYGGKSLYE